MKSSILIVLAIGFAGFGALEVAALNPSEALTKSDDVTLDTPVQDSRDTLPDVSPVKDVTCLTPALVAAFEPRHQALEARSADMDVRQAELKALEATVQGRLEEMEQTRDELQALTERLDVVAGEDITHLVDMYSTMKAKKAAAIFDRMDPAFAAGFIREIDGVRAGAIMAEMGEEQSYRVSLLIANRHADWRNKQ